MVPQESELDQAPVWDYAVNKVSEKKELVAANVKGSQFAKPYLEFSGSCAGCAETAYARLVTQVCGERMFISNATGCSSIWGNPAATSPFTVNECGHGPAWNNSLFEDNAEHGLGLALGYDAVQEKIVAETEKILQCDKASEALKEAATAWLANRKDTEGSKIAAAAYIAELEKSDCETAKAVLADKAYLTKKAFWIFGGDGWAYDIGFGGLDHVLASGNNVNVFVFDTEVYSNTGGQASKASNIGQVAQFAASGKVTKKKSLAEIAMSYGYVYVAQVAMGANHEPDAQGHPRGRELRRPVADHRLQPVRDALHQGWRHAELPDGDEEGRGVRLLEPLPLQPGRACGQEVHARLQGAGWRVPGLPHERGPLHLAHPLLPRARQGALRP